MEARCYQISSRVSYIKKIHLNNILIVHTFLIYRIRQSTPASYEHFTREVLSAGETVRQRSITLRSTLDDIYNRSLKDLRDQASRVDTALAAQINLTEGICLQLEKELQRV